MKLQHYLGGLEGLDPVETVETQVFVEPWEKRIFGIHVAMMGLSQHLSEALPQYPIDQVPTQFKSTWTWADLRKGAEAMNPFDYFKYRYYEKWLGGISQFFIDQGYITAEELEARTQTYLEKTDAPLPSLPEPAIDAQVIEYLRIGDPAIREVEAQPQFMAGQSVKIKDVPTTDHTRLPGYLRNKTGVIDKVYDGAYAYLCSTGPDGLGDPMYVYSVRFDPKEIWGQLSEDKSWVYADLFEVYVEAA
ncbi:MAG: nitrile hydratase subunit beta [Elainellaceae cyanobacterium]